MLKKWKVLFKDGSDKSGEFTPIYTLMAFILTDYGISNDMANYMTTVFDRGFSQIALNFWSLADANNEFGRYDRKLEGILTRENITIIQLFKNIAIT